MHLIGIDEAGRGSLAGPVMVAAVSIPKGFRPRSGGLPKLRDSKKLTARERAVWFEYIKLHPNIKFSTSRVYQKGIDRMNISISANIAASRALDILMRDCEIHKNSKILLDGSLYLGKKHHIKTKYKTIIHGDEKISVIKLASIVAKETRDAYMRRLGKKFPQYQLALHKGYGTELHRALIALYGPSEIHRLTFIKKYLE